MKGLGTTLANALQFMDMPTSGRLRYIGAVPFLFRVAVSLSLIMDGNLKDASFALYKYDNSESSGAILTGSEIDRHMAAGPDIGSVSLHWDVELDNNDYLELHVANLTDDTDLTLTRMYFSAIGGLV